MARRKAFLAPPYHTSCDAALVKMNAVFDDVENLARTQIPLPYAQVGRIACLIFLVVLPFTLASKLKWFVLPTSFLANIVYFTIDECAAEMETPFGPDENDVDVDKLTRRIDKHTAAIVGLWTGKPAIHYDIFPDTNSQHASRLGRTDTLYRIPTKSDHSSRSSVSETSSTGKSLSVTVVQLEEVQVESAAANEDDLDNDDDDADDDADDDGDDDGGDD